MSAVKSLLFCTDCGNLLDRSPGSARIVCSLCGCANPDTSSKTIVSKSNPKSFPSALRLKRSVVQAVASEDLQTEAKISQQCPECGSPEMWFYTLQLRSADEGATVFYRCDCGHRFNTNN